MQISNITLSDVRNGKNWRVKSPDTVLWEDILLEQLEIEECNTFEPEDMIIYSAIAISGEDKIKPIVLIKQIGDFDYGGDWCEFVNNKWRQVGLEPNPNAQPSDEYIANPLDEDPSFGEEDYRALHREGFRKHIHLLNVTAL